MNKNYSQNGLAQDVEYGKNGLQIRTSNGYLEVLDSDGVTLVKHKIANGVDADDAVNKGQLDLKLDLDKIVTDINAVAGNVADAPTVLAAINTQIAALVDSSPAALDTLNELAAALGDDPDFATTVTNLIAANTTKIGNLETLSGVASGSTDLGTFTGDVITDNSTTKVALQELETAIEDVNTDMMNSMCRKQAFTFESGASFDVQTLDIPANKYIKKVSVQMTTAFDDGNATLEIGITGDTDKYMPHNLVDLEGNDSHSTKEMITAVGASPVRVLATMNAASSTAGAGIIMVEYC